MEWKKFKPNYPYVEIWWDDAAALDSGWLSPEEFQKLKKEPQVVLTRGWLIEETAEHLYYCCDVGPKGETNGRGQIPKKMVKEMSVLNPRKRMVPQRRNRTSVSELQAPHSSTEL